MERTNFSNQLPNPEHCRKNCPEWFTRAPGWALSLMSLDFAAEIFAFLSERTPAAWISSSLYAPPTAALFLVYFPEMLLLPVGLISADTSSMPWEFRAGSFWSSRRPFDRSSTQTFSFWSLDNPRQRRTAPNLQKLEISSFSLSLPHQRSLWIWPLGDTINAKNVIGDKPTSAAFMAKEKVLTCSKENLDNSSLERLGIHISQPYSIY